MRVGERTGKGMSVKIYTLCKACPEHETVPLQQEPEAPPCSCKICERERAGAVNPWF